MNALIKQALSQGMNRLVLITFRQMLATLFLGPIAYFKERKMRPKFTTEIFVYTFLSGILGPVLVQYTLFVGLDYTTATFAATFGNLLPVVTFLISLAFRFEAPEVRSRSGTAHRRSGLTRGDLGFLNMTRMTVERKSLSGHFFFLLSGCVLFSLMLLASSEDWFSHYFSYTYVQSHSLNEQQAQ